MFRKCLLFFQIDVKNFLQIVRHLLVYMLYYEM